MLTRAQWKGVVDFANAVDSRIVTSFANGAGPQQARRLDKHSSKRALTTPNRSEAVLRQRSS